LLSEIERVVEESSRKIMQTAEAPMKYWLLLDVQKRDRDDPLLLQMKEECVGYPPRVLLLRSLGEDGTWPIPRLKRREEERGPGPPVGWTYITMLRNQWALGDYAADVTDGNLAASFDKLLSWQTSEGYIPGPETAVYPAPSYNGFALRNLLEFGFEDDPRTQRLADWLLKRQRHDGGWNMPYIQDMRYLPEYRQMRMREFVRAVETGKVREYDPDEYDDIPSCIWTTLMVLRGFNWSQTMMRKKALRKGCDFVLDRFFQRNYHPAPYQSEENWTTLKYPTYAGSGLSALEVRTNFGYDHDDPRLRRPVRWLLDSRSKDGYWYRSERPSPEKDHWITEIAVSILARYANIYRR
jgi:hypothetical protein